MLHGFQHWPKLRSASVSASSKIGLRNNHPREHSNGWRSQTKAQTSGRVIFSGIQPTGAPHLGNILGALRQWQVLQTEALDGDQLYFCVADLHALTNPRNICDLKRSRHEVMASLLAIGIDPRRCNVFFQSSVRTPRLFRSETQLVVLQVPEHTELMWILSSVTSVGQLTRMTQWKVCISFP